MKEVNKISIESLNFVFYVESENVLSNAEKRLSSTENYPNFSEQNMLSNVKNVLYRAENVLCTFFLLLLTFEE